MPESKGRKKQTRYMPEQPKGERKVARIGSPAWLAPTMVACFVIGLVYIVLFYLLQGNIPVLGALGALANVGIGFGFIAVGFVLSTKWH